VTCRLRVNAQAQLHQMRSDTNLVETPWVDDKDQLPQGLYTWQAPPPLPTPVAAGRWRKVTQGGLCPQPGSK
jgi:hypothetical protein